MTIKKALKTYYTEKLRTQKLPEMPEIIDLPEKKSDIQDRWKIFKQSLVFHAVLFLFVGLFLWINSSTNGSMRSLDPGNERIHYVEQQIKKGIDQIFGYFYPRIEPTNKGGQV